MMWRGAVGLCYLFRFFFYKKKHFFIKINMTQDTIMLRYGVKTTITDDMSYNLRTHMERNENSTYMHDIDIKTKSKNTKNIYRKS